MSGYVTTAKYDERQQVFESIRNQGVALSDAAAKIRQMCVWRLEEMEAQRKEVKNDRGTGIIAGVAEYMRAHARGAFDDLGNDKVTLSYAVFGSLRGAALLGEPSQGLSHKLDWRMLPVTVDTYTGVDTVLPVSSDLALCKTQKCRDRQLIAKATGWDRNAVMDMSPMDVSSFVNLASRATCGGNRLTRLVKGCLMYLHLMEQGSQTLDVKFKLVEYTPATVINAFRVSGRSFAFCSQASRTEYLTTLMLIGQQYPPPGFSSEGRVEVPEDGDHHVVVMGVPLGISNGLRVTLSAHAVYASLAKYSAEIGEADALEEALVIASSLYYNRYLEEVSLPAVNSTCELVQTGFVEQRTVHNVRPYADMGTLKAIGKLHQMQMLLIIKDTIMSAKMTTSGGADYRRATVNAFSTYEMVLLSKMVDLTAMRLLERTRRMRWANSLREKDVSELDQVSVFECLWLSEFGSACMREGGIKTLRDARKDGNEENPYTRVVAEEIEKAGIDYDISRLPDGDFTVTTRFVQFDGELGLTRPTFNKIRRNKAPEPVKQATSRAGLYRTNHFVPRSQRPATPPVQPMKTVEPEPEVVEEVEVVEAEVSNEVTWAAPVQPASVVAGRPPTPVVAGARRHSRGRSRSPVGAWRPKRELTDQPVPPAVARAEVKVRQAGAAANEMADTITERLLAHDLRARARKDSVEARRRASEAKPPAGNAERTLAARGVPHAGYRIMGLRPEAFSSNVCAVLGRGLTDDEMVACAEKLADTTLEIKDVVNWPKFLEILCGGWAMQLDRKLADSGSSYWSQPNDGVFVLAAVRAWVSDGCKVVNFDAIMRFASEFKLNSYETRVLEEIRANKRHVAATASNAR